MEDPNFRRLHSGRLTLRRFRFDDATALAAYRDDPKVARFQAWQRPYSVKDAREFIASLEGLPPGRPGTWFQFAASRPDVDNLVGDIGLRTTSEDPSHCELGFTFAAAYQGFGYAAEAVGAVLDYAVQKLEMRRCFAITGDRNSKARRLLERSCFDLESQLPDSSCLYGRAL